MNKLYIISAMLLFVSACSTVALDEETVRYSAATNTAMTALKPIAGDANRDYRRFAFGNFNRDRSLVFGDAVDCGKVLTATAQNPLPICARRNAIDPALLKPVNQALSSIQGYAKVLALLVDDDALEAAQTQATALATSLTALEGAMTTANILSGSDPYDAGIGTIKAAIVKASDAEARNEAIQYTVIESGPEISKMIVALTGPLQTIASTRRDLIRDSYNQYDAAYAALANCNPKVSSCSTFSSEAERRYMLGAIQALAEAQEVDVQPTIASVLAALNDAQSELGRALVAGDTDANANLETKLRVLELSVAGLAAQMKSFGHPNLVTP